MSSDSNDSDSSAGYVDEAELRAAGRAAAPPVPRSPSPVVVPAAVAPVHASWGDILDSVAAGDFPGFDIDDGSQFRRKYTGKHATLFGVVGDGASSKLGRGASTPTLFGLDTYKVADVKLNIACNRTDPLAWPLPARTGTVEVTKRARIESMDQLAGYANRWVARVAVPDGTPARTWDLSVWCAVTWACVRSPDADTVEGSMAPSTRYIAAAILGHLVPTLAAQWPTTVRRALGAAAVAQRAALGSIRHPDSAGVPTAALAAAAGDAWTALLCTLAVCHTTASLWPPGTPVVGGLLQVAKCVHAASLDDWSVVVHPFAAAGVPVAASWRPAGGVLPDMKTPGEIATEVSSAALSDLVLSVWVSRAAWLAHGGDAPLLESALFVRHAPAYAEFQKAVGILIGAASVAIPATTGESDYFRSVVEWACGFRAALPPVKRPPMTRIQRALAAALRTGTVGREDAKSVVAGLSTVYPGKIKDAADALWAEAEAEAARRNVAATAAKLWVFPPKVRGDAASAHTTHIASEPVGGGRLFRTPAFKPELGTRVWVHDAETGFTAKFGILRWALTTASGVVEGVLCRDDGAFAGYATAQLMHVSPHDVEGDDFPSVGADGAMGSWPDFRGGTVCTLQVVFGDDGAAGREEYK